MTEKQHRSITEFVRREYGRMVGYVRARIDDAAELDGEDIVQDVMAGLLVRAGVAGPIEDLAAYAYQALRNRVVDAFRRRRATVSLDAPVGESEEGAGATLGDLIAGPEGSRDAGAGRSWRLEQLRRAIALLGDDQRAVLVATEIQGKSFSELAAEWNTPIGTLLARKSRAMARVREMLSTADTREEE